MGWFDETTKTFEVYNQPLYSFPDTRDMFPPTIYGILKDEDTAVHVRRAMFSNIDKTAIHKFRNDIDNGNYAYGWPTVETNFKIGETPELQDVLDGYYGVPVDILSVDYGVPTIENWVLSQLCKDPSQLGFEFNVCPDSFTDLTGMGDGIGKYWRANYDELSGKWSIDVQYDDVGGVPNIVYYTDVDLPAKPTVPHYIVKVETETNQPATNSAGGTPGILGTGHPIDTGDGSTDYRLDGQGSFFMIHGGKYFHYYVGAEGERHDSNTGPSWRRLHLQTSDDRGATWTKHGPILPDFFPNNGEEEGHYDCLVVDDTTHFTMYFGAMTQLASNADQVDSEIWRATSPDGISWTVHNLVLTGSNFSLWTGEISPVGISNNRRYLYYFGKEGHLPDWGLGVFDMVENRCFTTHIPNVLGSASGVMNVGGTQYLTLMHGARKDGWYTVHEFLIFELDSQGLMIPSSYKGKILLANQAWPYLAYDESINRWIFVKSFYDRSNYVGDDRLMHHDVYMMDYTGGYDISTFLSLENVSWVNYQPILLSKYCRTWGYNCDGGGGGVPPGPGEFTCDYWVYNPEDGTYPELDLPNYDFGSGTGKAEAFPEVPLRYRNFNFNEDGSPLDEGMIEDQLDNVRLDGSKIIKEIMSNEDIADDPNKVDNIYIKFHVRLWDESIAGRQYLYTFFKGLFDFHFNNSGGAEQPTNCKKLIDPGNSGGLDDGAYIVDESACNSITVYTDFHWYKFGFSTVRNTFYTLDQISQNIDLYNLYHSNYKSFDKYGNFTKVFYTSSGSLLTPAGFTAENQKDVDNWLRGGSSGKKSAMRLADDAPGLYWLKPANRIIRYEGDIYDAEGNISTMEELVPEYVYVRFDVGGVLYPRIIPLKPGYESVPGVSEITYYEVGPNGMDAYTVFGPEAIIQVQDTETNTGSLVTLELGDANKISVPYFYGMLLNDVGQHPATDAFITGLHIGVYVADVTTVKLPWWQIAIKVVGFVIALYTAYAGGFIWYQALLYATVMYMSAYYLAKIVFEIAGEFGLFAQIVAAIFVAIISQQMAGGGSILGKTFDISSMSLSQMLLNFTKLLSFGFKEYQKLEIEDMLEDEKEEQDQNKILQDEISRNEKEGKSLLDSEELIESLMSDTRASITPMDPAMYFDAQENFVNIGTSAFDYDSIFEEQYEFRTL